MRILVILNGVKKKGEYLLGVQYVRFRKEEIFKTNFQNVFYFLSGTFYASLFFAKTKFYN